MRAVRKAFNQMLTSCLLAVVASPAIAQSPEMARLAKALAGDWSAVEVVQFGKPVPPGAGRKGTTHVRLAGGGMVLVDEGHAVGTVGGDTLVNEYVEGSTKMRDAWSDFTPTSYTLTEQHDDGNGVMQPYVASHITKMP